METWSISGAAHRCGVSPHTVRYYERCGVIPPITRDGAGRRVFTADDLGWVEYAVCLRSIGMNIAEVRRYVEVAADPDRAGHGDHVAMLESPCARMKAQRAELDAWIDVIEHKLTRRPRVIVSTRSTGPTDSPGTHGARIATGGHDAWLDRALPAVRLDRVGEQRVVGSCDGDRGTNPPPAREPGSPPP